MDIGSIIKVEAQILRGTLTNFLKSVRELDIKKISCNENPVHSKIMALFEKILVLSSELFHYVTSDYIITLHYITFYYIPLHYIT